MQFAKNRTMATVLIAFVSFTAHGQMINHNMPPPQPPPPQAPPSIPQLPFIPPMVPVFPAQMAQPTVVSAPDDFYKTNPEYLKIRKQEMSHSARANELDNVLNLMEINHEKQGDYVRSVGSLEEAEFYLDGAARTLDWTLSDLAKNKGLIAALLEKKRDFVALLVPGATSHNNNIEWEIERIEWEVKKINKLISINYTHIALLESQIETWSLEAATRVSKKDQVENELKKLRLEYQAEQAESEKLNKERRAIEKKHDGEMRREEERQSKPSRETVSAGDLETDEFFGGTKSSKSSETADIAPIKSMQELREDSVREAFSEMGSLNFQTGFLEKVDMAGQVSQTVIGFIPGLSGTDVALSGVRGFAEALGDEMSKGTSWGDALSIAAVNAGIKGAVSIVGNKLTGGADKMANRVAVLTEVGFAKLTTKQVAEYGANGISFLVVKSGQVLGQAAVDEFVGKPVMKKIADAIKSAKHVSGSSASGGGYGMSVATQPLVAY